MIPFRGRSRSWRVGAAILAALGAGPSLPGTPATAAAPGASTRELLQAGTLALEESNFARAAARFREAAEIDPRLAQAHLGMGLAALGERDRKAAERELRQAVDLTGRSPEALYSRGIARFVFNDLRAAAEDLAAASAADAYFLEARHAAGIVAAARGDLQDAEVRLRDALRIDSGHAPSRYQLGAVLARAGRLDEGLDELGRALQADPGILDARPEDPIYFAGRAVRSGSPPAGPGIPIPALRPSITWPRPRPGTEAAAAGASLPDWFLYDQTAALLADASQWRAAADMLERALSLQDRSELSVVVAGRLVDYLPHLHLAEAYFRLGSQRDALLHLGIARSEGLLPPGTIRSLEVLITHERLRPKIYLEALPARTTDPVVTVRGLLISEESVKRVEVSGREAVIRPPQRSDLDALLPRGSPRLSRDPGLTVLFEVAALRLPALGPNRITIRPEFNNPARDGEVVEVMVVREPAPGRAGGAVKP